MHGVLGGSLKRGDFSNGKVARKEGHDAKEEKCVGFVEFIGLVGFGGFVGLRQRSGGVRGHQ